MLTLIILITVILSISVYLYLIFKYQDFKTKKVNVGYFKVNKYEVTNILFIYPHPDDETMGSGGLIQKLSRNKKFDVHVISLTRGEKGKELKNLPDSELAEIRTKEFTNAVTILGAKQFEIWNYPDGKIEASEQEIKKQLLQYIEEHEIDTVVTYERTGIYGHKDHVALSRYVHDISKRNKQLKVFYATIAPKVEELYNFPKHIVGLKLTKNTLCEKPEVRINKLLNSYRQYKAAKAHRSQRLNHIMPLWLALLLQPYEYYTTIYTDSTKS